MEKRIVLCVFFFTLFAVLAGAQDNGFIAQGTFHANPVIRSGSSAYHDSLGARDPYVVKSGGKFYLFYDCTEGLLNPSFESNWGTNGWESWQAEISSTSTVSLSGSRSLRVEILTTPGGGAYTGDYYYNFLSEGRQEENWAVPIGLEVLPDIDYVASAYVLADEGKEVELLVQQYIDDPRFYWENLIEEGSVGSTAIGDGEWHQISVNFKSDTNVRAITISLTGELNSVSYWDGVQLEQKTGGASPFPTDSGFIERNYNRQFVDSVGWQPCVAVSADGISFEKLGLISIGGQREEWETIEKPGWVGSSSMYLNPFYHNGKWYAYNWQSGYELSPENNLDSGAPTRREGYGDRRAFLPIAIARSGLFSSNHPGGPYTRISGETPPILPNHHLLCDEQPNWGCDYLAASGAPVMIEGTWVEFLSGLTSWDETWTAISSGMATSDNPLSGWEVTDTPFLTNIQDRTDPDFLVAEGPMYFNDAGSGHHVVFPNNIGKGTIEAFWTEEPFVPWPMQNRKIVVDIGSVPWSQGKGGAIGLATVAEKESQLMLYFAARVNPQPLSYNNAWNKYLFHDIGLVTYTLPLLEGPSLLTCAEQGGDICTADKVCSGELLNASDSDLCCSTECETENAFDLDEDGDVDLNDVLALVSHWGETSGGTGDLNSDNKVNIRDLVLLARNIGE